MRPGVVPRSCAPARRMRSYAVAYITRVATGRIVASNAESARVAKLDNSAHDQLHGMDYLVYAIYSSGRTRKPSRHRRDDDGGGFHRDLYRRRMRLRLAGALCDRTRRLEGASELQVRAKSAPARSGHDAFARALGAAARAIRKPPRRTLAQAHRAARQALEAKDAYWSGQVDIPRQVATAWVL